MHPRIVLVLLVIAAGLCWVPWWLVAVPASAVMIAYLPGLAVVTLLHRDRHPGVPAQPVQGRGKVIYASHDALPRATPLYSNAVNRPAQPVHATRSVCTPAMVHCHERYRSTEKRLHRHLHALAVSLVMMPLVLQAVWLMTNARLWVWATVVLVNVLLWMAVWRRRGVSLHTDTDCLDKSRQSSHDTSWPCPCESQSPSPGEASERYTCTYGAPAGLSASLAFTARMPGRLGSRTGGLLLVGMLIWVAVFTFLSYYLPTAGTRMAAVPAHDFCKHHAVLFELDRGALPLGNPFYAAGADEPYYYYHWAYLPAAAVRIMAGRTASIAACFGVTSGLLAVAVVGVVFLLSRGVWGSSSSALLSAACVSLTGGFDAVMVLGNVMFARAGMVVTLDAWCPVAWRVHNVITQYLWCPQHVLAVLVLLVVALWLREYPRSRWWLVAAPWLATVLFGSSVYLAMTVFPAAAVYLVHRSFIGDPGQRLRPGRMLGAGVMIAGGSAILMAGQAWGYYLMSQRFGGSGLTAQWDRFGWAVVGRLVPPGVAANLLDLPWMLVADFGLPAVACVVAGGVAWRLLGRDAGMRLLIIAGVVGILAMFTLRSSLNGIDYGFRVSIMGASVAAAVIAGVLARPEMLRRWCRSWRIPLIVGGVVLGLPVGVYELPLTAVRTWLQRDPQQQDYAAMRYIHEELPADAVVQGHPADRLRMLERVERQIGVLDPWYPHVRVFWPEDAGHYMSAYDDVAAAFAEGATSQHAHRALRQWRVTHVLVGSVEKSGRGTEQFHNPLFFGSLYDDGKAAVYRVLPGRESLTDRQGTDDNRLPEDMH